MGRSDPTTRLLGDDRAGSFWRATWTPDGPGTVHVRWRGDVVLDRQAWGPGGEWLLDRVPALVGDLDEAADIAAAHPAVGQAARNHPGLRLGASGTLYHELLPVIIAQRITSGEAVAQWYRLVRQLGRPAPGPDDALRLPPDPAALVGRPAWWYHSLGIEAKRAEALREVARHADHIHRWADLPAAACCERLRLLRGVGVWTIGSTLGPALGDPDAFAIGDYHLKNSINWALAGRARGSDEEMVDLLAPYAGQRGRVVRLLLLDGHRAPAFGPRQRILPMRRW